MFPRNLTITLLCVWVPLAGQARGSEPVTLSRAQRLALSRHPTAANIKERVIQARVLTRRAWASLLPSLSANAAIRRNSMAIDLKLPRPGEPDGTSTTTPPEIDWLQVPFQDLWSKSFGFTASMVLLKAAAYPGLRGAYTNLELQHKRGRYDRNELAHAVAVVFYQVRSAEELVRAAQEDLDSARRFLREARVRRDVGQATRIDQLRAEIQVNAAEQRLQDARDSVRLSKNALRTLTGLGRDFTLASPPRQRDPGADLSRLEQLALRDRLDLRALDLNLVIAKRQREATLTRWIPEINATFDWTYQSAAGFAGDNDTWRLIFSGRWSILEGGDRVALMAEHASQIRTLRNQKRLKRLQIREEVRARKLELDQARRNLALSGRQLALAQTTHDLVKEQYNQGLATSLDVQSALTELQRRRTGEVDRPGAPRR